HGPAALRPRLVVPRRPGLQDLREVTRAHGPAGAPGARRTAAGPDEAAHSVEYLSSRWVERIAVVGTTGTVPTDTFPVSRVRAVAIVVALAPRTGGVRERVRDAAVQDDRNDRQGVANQLVHQASVVPAVAVERVRIDHGTICGIKRRADVA